MKKKPENKLKPIFDAEKNRPRPIKDEWFAFKSTMKEKRDLKRYIAKLKKK